MEIVTSDREAIQNTPESPTSDDESAIAISEML